MKNPSTAEATEQEEDGISTATTTRVPQLPRDEQDTAVNNMRTDDGEMEIHPKTAQV